MKFRFPKRELKTLRDDDSTIRKKDYEVGCHCEVPNVDFALAIRGIAIKRGTAKLRVCVELPNFIFSEEVDCQQQLGENSRLLKGGRQRKKGERKKEGKKEGKKE